MFRHALISQTRTLSQTSSKFVCRTPSRSFLYRSSSRAGSLLFGGILLTKCPFVLTHTRCEWKGNEEAKSFKKQQIQEVSKDESLVTTIFRIIWETIKESPFLSLSSIITGILNALVPLLIPQSTRKFLDVSQGSHELSELLRPTLELIGVGIASAIISALDYSLLTEFTSRLHGNLSKHLFQSFMRQDIVCIY